MGGVWVWVWVWVWVGVWVGVGGGRIQGYNAIPLCGYEPGGGTVGCPIDGIVEWTTMPLG